ncbi:MAG: TetR/AcrR family transcriptional regulator [Herpetosiphon sp.]
MVQGFDSAGSELALDAKTKYLAKLLPIVKQRGFSQLRIDDIVRHMDISKATFYKHFVSKEEVIERIVELVIVYLRQATAQIGDESCTYVQRFQRAFEQSVLIASYLSDAFLIDLKQVFPALWERSNEARRERQEHLRQFYDGGIAAGIFQPISAVLVMLQDELVLRAIIDAVFLMEHGLTLQAALSDYYALQKYQWLVPEIRVQVDDSDVQAYIVMMARKLALSMR